MTSTPNDVLGRLFSTAAKNRPNTLTSKTGQMIWNYATATGNEDLGEYLIRHFDNAPEMLRDQWAQIHTPVKHRIAYLTRADTPVETIVDTINDDSRVTITRALAGNVFRTAQITKLLAETCDDPETLAILLNHKALDEDADPDDIIPDTARIRVFELCVAYGPADVNKQRNWQSHLHQLDPTGLDRILTDPNVPTARKLDIYTRLPGSMIADGVGAIDTICSIIETFDDTVDDDDKHRFLQIMVEHPHVNPRAAELVLTVTSTFQNQINAGAVIERAEAILSATTGSAAEATRAANSTDVAELVAMAKQQLLGAPNGNCVTEALAANPAMPASFAAKYLVDPHPRAAAFTHPNAPWVVGKALTTCPDLAQDPELWAKVTEPAKVLKAIRGKGIPHPNTDQVFAAAATTLCALGRIDEISGAVTLERAQRTRHPLTEPILNALAERVEDVTSLLAVAAALNNRAVDDSMTVADVFELVDLVED